MPRPTAIEAAQKFRRRLEKQEAASFQRMSTLYSRILLSMRDEVRKLAGDVANATVDAETITVSRDGKSLVVNRKTVELVRLQRILNQVEKQVIRFGGTVEAEVSLVQIRAIDQASNDALKLLEFSLPDLPPDLRRAITASFIQLPAGAIEAAAGLLGDDSPLSQKLRRDFGEAVQRQVERHLLDGIAYGRNPRIIARKLFKNLEDSAGVGLKWAMTTVRTAQIKSFQLATHASYQANSHVIKGWVWLSARDSRTCLSCIRMHGTRHPLEEILRDHHAGRCTPVPQTITYADLGIEGTGEKPPKIQPGENWFKQQPRATQKAMMGPGMYAAWREGAFKFEDLSQKYSDPVYGELFRQASLKDLLGKKAKKFYANK